MNLDERMKEQNKDIVVIPRKDVQEKQKKKRR
jgi:hypothetical protein